MRKAAWAGVVPASQDEARERLVDAAIRCVQRHGLERTSVSDIAAEAGVARPTVYAYFGGRDEILTAAVHRAARRLMADAARYARRFQDPVEQIVEGILYAVRHVRGEADWSVRIVVGWDPLGGPSPLTGEGLQLARQVLRPVQAHIPNRATLDYCAEVVVRTVVSLLTLDGPGTRSDSRRRQLLYRWLVPALGLPLPARRRSGRAAGGAKPPSGTKAAR